MRHKVLGSVVVTCVLAAPDVSATATPPPLLMNRHGEGVMAHHHMATGTFEISIKKLEGVDGSFGASSLQKTFTGEMQATSTGQMLALRTATAGSAGYVAMERVTGTLAGRHGSFVLQHSGTMQGGSQSATIDIVPDSGTEGLQGLSGSMRITQDGGVHHYVLQYSLPN